MILVGNKCDLDNREVSREEGKSFAEQIGCRFYETSAKDRTNVEEIFHEIIREIRRDLRNNKHNNNHNYSRENNKKSALCYSIMDLIRLYKY